MSSDWKGWVSSKLDELDNALNNTVPGYELAKKISLNTITLGGQTALDTSKRLYEEERLRYDAGAISFNQVLSEVKAVNKILGANVAAGVGAIETAKELVYRLSCGRTSGPAIDSRATVRLADLRLADTFVQDFNAAQEAALGTGTGLAASAGAWFLVAHLGIASTGTAIGTLSGAAAYSATLAWFGGGAIAAGGGGMALGGMVLSGIAVLPSFGYIAYKSYSGAKDTDKATQKLTAKRAENEIAEADMRRLLPRIMHAAEQVRTTTIAFATQHKEIENATFALAAELSNKVAAFAQVLSSLERIGDS